MGSKGDDEREADSLDQDIYNQFYEAGVSGVSYSWEGDADRETAAAMGYEDGLAAADTSSSSSSSSSYDYTELFESLAASQAESEQAYEDALAEQEAEYEQAVADAEEETNLSRISTLYSSKFSAANSAVESVNDAIAEEKGYAAVGGADYSISDEEKTERINNTFASLWSSENESELAGLEEVWGSNGNEWTSGIVRGVTSEDDVEGEPGASAGGQVNPAVVLGMEDEDEEDELGGKKAVLGGL